MLGLFGASYEQIRISSGGLWLRRWYRPFIVVEPLLTPEPNPAPALELATIAKPTMVIMNNAPALQDEPR
jgi:hypothetical protein